MPRNGYLDAAVGAAREAVGAVGPREIERSCSVPPHGATRPLAPDGGGQRPILEATRETPALARGRPEHERTEHAEPAERPAPHERGEARANSHAAEPSAATCAPARRFEKPSIGPIGPDPYTHERT